MDLVMEMNPGKLLDEVCNHHNDVYRDEVLYAARVVPSRSGTGINESATLALVKPERRQ